MAEETRQTPDVEQEPKAEEKPAKGRKKDHEQKRQQQAAELEKLKKELESQQDAYQRVLAEYANYKRRTEQEKEQLGAFTRAEVIKALLPALDNLERAAAAPAGDKYKTGVDMTIRQLADILKGMGLEEIPAENAPFDPEVHNAVMREDADGVDPDTVTEVYQKGYRIGGRILRPAMVKVAN
ncbi:MAG: nucleotide exchange factor GrpE [Acutalibacteraceae bacterium]|jgi:molecular chaperone GrpE